MNKFSLTVLNTNARSLCPKINSFIDCFANMEAAIRVITKTWLTDGPELEKDIDDLCLGAGIGLLCLNRKPNDKGFSHGGVAISFRKSAISCLLYTSPSPRD